MLTFVNVLDFGPCHNVCRVEDYWQGYKLFCYAYYSHSLRHESEFRATKLGERICSFILVQ